MDPQHAALLNGIASHVHDYDETHLLTTVHPTGPLASAVLAYVEHSPAPTSGFDLMTALIAGIEISCKFGLSVWPSHYDIGWHITSTTGSGGTAVAVAKLMHLNETQTMHAIGIAATQATGLREMFGSDTKSFHLIELYPKLDIYCSASTPEGVGQTWEIERNAFKPFPCGIVCHPAIDGAIDLHQELEGVIQLQDITRVKLLVHPLVIELTSKRNPKDGLEGKFSVFHGAAVGLAYGKASPAEYADTVVTDATVIGLRDKIEARIDHGLRADEADITVTMNSGDVLHKHVDHAVGSLDLDLFACAGDEKAESRRAR
ncbi:hypothetical protein BST61_g3675 [Cercospora zeina]